MRKVGQAVKAAKGAASGAYKTAKAKAASAAVDVSLAGSMAKKKAGEVKQAVKDAPDKAKAAVSAAASDAKKKAKSGIKGFIKRQAQKVVNRMSEEMEAIEEDSRRTSNRQRTQRVRSNINAFGSDYTPPSNFDPDANRGQGEVLTAKQMEKKRRKALRQEELEATGLFSEKEIEAIMEAEMSEAMSSYDRNRKRAAQRAAARNAARDAGKTGVVPGVGYVTPRRERETYVDSAGVTRHKSGAKMEEVEAVGEGLTGERYKAALKKGKMYSRMVSADPEKRATRGGRGGESDFGAGDRGTGNRSRRRRGLSVGDED